MSTVDNGNYAVCAFREEKFSGGALLRAIGAKRVRTGQVNNGKIVVLAQSTVFFLHGDAGTIAHSAAAFCYKVEKSCFAAVRRARKGNNFFHIIP